MFAWLSCRPSGIPSAACKRAMFCRARWMSGRRRAEEAQAANVETVICSAESVPLPDGCADRLLMRNTLHHVVDADAVFDEFARLLRPGGRLLLEAPVNAWDEEVGRLLTDMAVRHALA